LFAAILFAVVLLGVLGFNGMFHKNDRFRSQFMKSIIFILILTVLPLGILFGTFSAMGFASAFQLWFSLGTNMVMAIGYMGLMFWMMGRSRAEIHLPGVAPKKTWEQWVVADVVKEQAQTMVESLRDWKFYLDNGVDPANGALFFGPPGTGKTLGAQVIASECGLPTVIVSAANLNGPFVGMGMLIVLGLARKVKKLAKKYGGAVCFIDEIDAIGMSRQNMVGGGGGMMPGSHGLGMGMAGNGSNGALQSLLTVMSGAASGETWLLKKRKQWGLAKLDSKQVYRILWIAATNIELNALDPALTRAGRLGSQKLYIGYPSADLREQMFDLYLTNKPVADDVDPSKLVGVSRHMTGADIKEVCDAAGRTAIRRARKESVEVIIEPEDLFDDIYMKKRGQPRALPLDEVERWPTAVHEAGHAVCLVHFTPFGFLCDGATLRPTEDYLAAVFREKDDRELSSQFEEDYFRSVLIAMGSIAAEKLVLGQRSGGATSDLAQGMGVSLQMVGACGFGEKLTSVAPTGGQYHGELIRQAENILNAAEACAELVIENNRGAVEALAHALVDRVNLSGQEVIDIVKANGEAPFESVMEQCKVIMAEMKEKDKAERRENALLSAPGSFEAIQGEVQRYLSEWAEQQDRSRYELSAAADGEDA